MEGEVRLDGRIQSQVITAEFVGQSPLLLQNQNNNNNAIIIKMIKK